MSNTNGLSLRGKKLRGKRFHGNLMGEDFSNADLRGADFSGATLTDTKFVEADIRSANFANASLSGADFTDVRAGVQQNWVTFLLVAAFLGAVFFGIWSTVAASFAAFPFIFGLTDEKFYPAPGLDILRIFTDLSQERVSAAVLAYLICFLTFVRSTLRQGLQSALRIIGWAVAAVVILFIFVGVVGFILWRSADDSSVLRNLAGYPMAVCTGITAFLVTGIWSLVAVIGLGVSSVTAELIATPRVAAAIRITALVFAVIWASLGSVATAFSVAEAGHGAGAAALAVALSWGATSLILRLSNFVAQSTLTEESRFGLVRRLAIGLATWKGTNFQQADLQEATFTRACLNSTNLTHARMIQTCWKGASQLDRARVDATYLDNPQVLQLVVTGNGRDQNFNQMDLRGVYLKEFDLSGAILVQTRLEQADLRGANLTGACIEDWGIHRSTRIEGVVCKYVYMRYYAADKRSRVPLGNEEFENDQFQQFVRSLLDTLNLYHKRSLNPVATILALKELTKTYKESLEIVAIENRDDAILLRLRISGRNENDLLEKEYSARYRYYLESAAVGFSENEKNFIDTFSDLLKQLQQEPNHSLYVNFAAMHIDRSTHFSNSSFSNSSLVIVQGDVQGMPINLNSEGAKQMVSFVGGDNVGGDKIGGDKTGGDKIGGDNTFSQGTTGVAGKVTESTIDQSQPLASEHSQAPELTELLQQVRAAIDADPDLSQTSKEIALEQLDKIEKLGNDPQAPDFASKANKAKSYLDFINELLSGTTDLFQKVTPIFNSILALFGF